MDMKQKHIPPYPLQLKHKSFRLQKTPNKHNVY